MGGPGGGWSTWTSPRGSGRSEGGRGGNGSCPGRNGIRRPPPPPEMGVKMFERAQLNLFSPERKNGGPSTGDSSPTAGRRWAWGGWSMGGQPGPGRHPGGR